MNCWGNATSEQISGCFSTTYSSYSFYIILPDFIVGNLNFLNIIQAVK